MKIIVAFKWLRSPQDARVGADGSVDWRGARMAPNDDDPAAIAMARELGAGGEVLGLTVGDGDLAWAAARGAASTLVVTDADTHPPTAPPRARCWRPACAASATRTWS